MAIASYKMLQLLFSRKGLTFWLEKPTNRQSSCSCSVTYLMMSFTACVTGIRCIAASRRNCSVTALKEIAWLKKMEAMEKKLISTVVAAGCSQRYPCARSLITLCWRFSRKLGTFKTVKVDFKLIFQYGDWLRKFRKFSIVSANVGSDGLGLCAWHFVLFVS